MLLQGNYFGSIHGGTLAQLGLSQSSALGNQCMAATSMAYALAAHQQQINDLNSRARLALMGIPQPDIHVITDIEEMQAKVDDWLVGWCDLSDWDEEK